MGRLWLAAAAPIPHGGNVEARRTRNSRLSLSFMRSDTAGVGLSFFGPGDRSRRIWGVVNLPLTAAPSFYHRLALAAEALKYRQFACSRHSFTDTNPKDGKQPCAAIGALLLRSRHSAADPETPVH